MATMSALNTGSMSMGSVTQSGMLAAANRLTNAGSKNAANAVTDEQLAKLNPKAKAAAKAFETYYIQQFVSLMAPVSAQKDLEKDGFGGGFGEEMFRQQLNEKMADGITKRGGFGLSDAILKQMVMKQEAQEALAAEAAGATPLASARAAAKAYSAN